MHPGTSASNHISHEWLCLPAFSLFSLFLLPDFVHRPAVNQELSNIFNELWRLDVNRWTPGIDYTISVQVESTFLLMFMLH